MKLMVGRHSCIGDYAASIAHIARRAKRRPALESASPHDKKGCGSGPGAEA